jgi:hypothetical protein
VNTARILCLIFIICGWLVGGAASEAIAAELPSRDALDGGAVSNAQILGSMPAPEEQAIDTKSGQRGDVLSAASVERFARLALDCVHREYPNKISHVLRGDEDARPPRKLTPVFYGCFDWHSAVHGHWLLVRLCRMYPEASFVPEARAALAESFTPEHVAGEMAYLTAEGRYAFERPYGLAWFLQLTAELREWNDPQAQEWARTLAPMEEVAATRFKEWLPKLSHPVRTGLHSQTAFAMGLAYDWACVRGDREFAALIEQRARHYYLNDRGASLSFEPSGHDFLSPILAEADLMRRILPPTQFAAWLGAFLPTIPLDGQTDWLPVAVVTDKADGHLVHLDGLNLSRAWMLEGIIDGLPAGDPRLPSLRAAAAQHREAGVKAVDDAHYEGGHWLGSFAVYLVTQRGIELRE